MRLLQFLTEKDENFENLTSPNFIMNLIVLVILSPNTFYYSFPILVFGNKVCFFNTLEGRLFLSNMGFSIVQRRTYS